MKKRQHYVWRLYLRPWALREKLWCLRAGHVFESGLMGVATENYFYEPQVLEEQDIHLIERAFIQPSHPRLRQAQLNLLAGFRQVSTCKTLLERLRPDSQYYSEIENNIFDFEENYHCAIEQNLEPALRSMLSGNTDFYSKDDQSADFLLALCVQYFRTKKMREAVIQVPTPIPGSNLRRVWNTASHIVAMNVAMTLFVERKGFTLTLLHNTTPTPFITGDQPVINLHPTTSNGCRPELLELYYPISPKAAMLLIINGSRNHTTGTFATSEEVSRFNEMIAHESHEQLFATSPEELEKFA